MEGGLRPQFSEWSRRIEPPPLSPACASRRPDFPRSLLLTRPPAAANGWGASRSGQSRVTCREESTRGALGVWLSGHGSLLLPAAPESLSPAGGAGEEAPDEDEAEAEDSERPGASGGARGGGGGGGGGAGPGSCGGPGGALTRRAVTLRVLLKDALLEPGAGVLSIYYLGKKFVGDLQPDGRIVWQETGQVFNSPSAWATHCKKLVNPAKKSGCGWASVKYKGQKLDKYKAAWLRRNQLHIPAAAADEWAPGATTGTEGSGQPEVSVELAGRVGSSQLKVPSLSPQPRPRQSPASEGEEEELMMEEEEEEVLTGASAEDKSRRPPVKGPSEPVHPEATPPGKRVENKIRVPVRYCMLGSRDSARNPHTLVEVTSFAAINKFQPFNVAISSNVLFLLDFHSHLTRSQVVGYLGGRWDINSQMLTVLRAFPCRSRLGDADTAAAMEEEIYQSLLLRGLSLVGWYHSHPYSPALPSLQDIDAQMDYQLRLQGSSNGFQPCLALLCSPYYSGNPGPESKISPFWVMPPPEQRPSDYGIPMDVEMAYVQDGFLTNDVLHEMMLLVEFYKGAPDLVRFQEPWNQEHTYLDKLKISLASRTPKDQGLCHVLEQVYSVLRQGS
ncbi:MPN domain-containing protein isoform X2 [Globicephala melas]|uniref:MPN domain-containing protein isoform X2 n=1 Tax=Globicephala melas TaxID=9731 RepID=UPI00293D7D5E|nr:MPN domain-containing protein isoform X2 [Globicephala melas]